MREPQQDRSRATRQRLLSAAVGCVLEHGMAAATVSSIAERAGVSRGAAQHHFATREQLVTAVVEHLSEVQGAELRRRAEEMPDGPGRTEAIVEMLLTLYTGPMFRVALHLWVAAATDPTLHPTVAELEARVGRELHRVAVELLGVDESLPGAREAVQASLDLARGLGLANLLSDDTRRRSAVIRQWAHMLKPVIGEQSSGT